MKHVARKGRDWVRLLEEKQAAGLREGDHVRIDAPAGTQSATDNGKTGLVVGFNNGWVIVDLPRKGRSNFRADELR